MFAVSYDGAQKVELLQAVHGGVVDVYIRSDKNYVILRDGDTLLALDLVKCNYRELVSHPYLRSRCYFDSEYIDGKFVDSDRIYFEAYEGLYVGGFTLNINTGELKTGYRL